MKFVEIAAVMIAITLIGGFAIMTFAPKVDYAGAEVAQGANNSYAQNINQNSGTARTPSAAGGDKVAIPIKVVNGYYQPREIRVKQGSMVRLEFDRSSFVGCMRVFNIWNYGVRVDTAQNATYEFVAYKKGTFRTSCNMGMGDGAFVVE